MNARRWTARLQEYIVPVVYLLGSLAAAVPALFYAGGIASGFPKAAYADALIIGLLSASVALMGASVLAAFARPAGHRIAIGASTFPVVLLGSGVVEALIPRLGWSLWVWGFTYSLLLPFLCMVVVFGVAYRSVAVHREPALKA